MMTTSSPAQLVFMCNIPNSFDFKNPSSWERWIQRFERYRILSGLNLKPNETQISALIYCLGEDAEDIISVSSLSSDEQKDYEKVKSMFENYFINQQNVVYKRAKFNLRSQRENESIEAFAIDLRKLGEHCKYGNMLDELIRDRIVIGVRDKQLSENLQLDADLTLEKAINICCEKEAICQQQNDLQSVDSHNAVDINGFQSSDRNEALMAELKEFRSEAGEIPSTMPKSTPIQPLNPCNLRIPRISVTSEDISSFSNGDTDIAMEGNNCGFRPRLKRKPIRYKY